jgi:hypothetical protein
LRKVDNVVAFVGDGNILVRDKRENAMALKTFAGKDMTKKPISCFESLGNGYFVLTFIDGLSKMYDSNARGRTIEVKDSTFLPDGCFVCYDRKLITGVYNRHGILDRREIFSFEKTNDYYLFSGDSYNGYLYNAKGEKLGENYVLLKSKDNFTLFEHEGQIELFNQYGRVFKF